MSINFCTLTGSTLDTFCGNRRQLVLDRLLDEKYPTPPAVTLGTNNRNVSIDFAKRYPHLTRHVEDDDVKTLEFEQPFIIVTAELLGIKGEQRLDADRNLNFVVVTDLQLMSTAAPKQVDLAVNITDFRML